MRNEFKYCNLSRQLSIPLKMFNGTPNRAKSKIYYVLVIKISVRYESRATPKNFFPINCYPGIADHEEVVICINKNKEFLIFYYVSVISKTGS